MDFACVKNKANFQGAGRRRQAGGNCRCGVRNRANLGRAGLRPQAMGWRLGTTTGASEDARPTVRNKANSVAGWGRASVRAVMFCRMDRL